MLYEHQQLHILALETRVFVKATMISTSRITDNTLNSAEYRNAQGKINAYASQQISVWQDMIGNS